MGQHIRREMQKKRDVKETEVRQQSNSLLRKAGGAALAVGSKERLKQGLEQRFPERDCAKHTLEQTIA